MQFLGYTSPLWMGPLLWLKARPGGNPAALKRFSTSIFPVSSHSCWPFSMRVLSSPTVRSRAIWGCVMTALGAAEFSCPETSSFSLVEQPWQEVPWLLLQQQQQTPFPLLMHLFRGTVTNGRCKPVRDSVWQWKCHPASVSSNSQEGGVWHSWRQLLGTDLASGWSHGWAKDGSVSYLATQSVSVWQDTQRVPHKP